MSHMEELMQKMQVESEFEDIEWIEQIKKEIQHFTGRYHVRMKEKNFVMADSIIKIINVYKEILHARTNNARSIFSSPTAGDKRIFVLKR